MDLAWQLGERHLGEETADATAAYMEYMRTQ
jgi:hypothetical protein